MNTLLWIVQGILGIKFLTTAFSHGIPTRNANMKQAIEKMGGYSLLLHRLVALVILFSAVAIILPAYLGMDNRVTIYAALLQAGLMLVSIPFHVLSREKPLVIADVILLLLAAFVAYGRWRLFPL